MPKITLDEFCAHWVEGKYVTKMPNKLQYNVFDFVTLAGDYFPSAVPGFFFIGRVLWRQPLGASHIPLGKTVHAPGDERFGNPGKKHQV